MILLSAPNIVVRQGIRVGENAVVNAGSVVIRHVLNGATAAGNPIQLITA